MRLCLLGAVFVGLVGCGTDQELARAMRDKAKAEQDAAEARAVADRTGKELQEQQEVVERLQRELGDFEKRITAALDAAANVAERDAAVAKLKALQTERAELESRLAAAKKAAATKRWGTPNAAGRISEECLRNPLAKGC